MYSDTVSEWSIRHFGWMSWVAFIATLLLLFACAIYKNSYPHNYCLLFGFTLCQAYSIGVVCAMYRSVGLEETLLRTEFSVPADAKTATLYVSGIGYFEAELNLFADLTDAEYEKFERFRKQEEQRARRLSLSAAVEAPGSAMKKRKGHGPLPDGSYPSVTLRMLYPRVRLRMRARAARLRPARPDARPQTAAQ